MGQTIHTFLQIERPKPSCKTPSAVYSTSFERDFIDLGIRLPLRILNPPHEKELVAELHNAILPVIEKLYRERWNLFAGKEVDNGGPLPPKWEDL